MSEQEKQKNGTPDDIGENSEELLESADEQVGDSVNEDDAAPAAGDLAGQLEAANKKAEEHWGKLVRAMAEIDNLRKRHERDLESAHKYGLERFANELLQVRDSLELGHQAALDEDVEVKSLREGTELTLKLLKDVMEKFGVEQVNPEGEPFNPELHQAMSMMPSADHDPSTVVQVVQKGYLLNGRLLRPAMVIVSAAA